MSGFMSSVFMPPVCLVGADVLTGSSLQDRPVGMAMGQIVDPQGLPQVDLSGYWLMPGIIDLHTDAVSAVTLAEQLVADARSALCQN